MKRLKAFLLIVLGGFMLAFSVAYFVLPYNILSGGVAGISIILNEIFHYNPTTVINILMIGCFVLGYILIGKDFALKTVLGSASYTIFVNILSRFEFVIDVDPLLACIFGGILAGAGIGIVFCNNGSTGGVDIPEIIISKYTGIELSTVVMVFDIVSTLMGLVTFGLQEVMLGIIYIYCSSTAINKVMIPQYGEAVAVYIISEKRKEISQFIHIDLDRGTTIIPAKGGFTNQDKEIILTVVSKQQYVKLNSYIEKTDPYAFIIVSDAKEIKGEGFTFDPRV